MKITKNYLKKLIREQIEEDKNKIISDISEIEEFLLGKRIKFVAFYVGKNQMAQTNVSDFRVKNHKSFLYISVNGKTAYFVYKNVFKYAFLNEDSVKIYFNYNSALHIVLNK